ncbi:MAG: hypothetical protein Q8K78_08825 [Planctomycetaceae bacterium]|nr:hypothetical protein [Planctomycetaceae bacterium]
MRRGTWILALSGAMALQAGGAFATDPSPPLRKPSGNTTIRTERFPATQSPTNPSGGKNYYEELFGEPAPLTPATKSNRSPAIGPLSESKRPPSAPPTKQIPLDDKTKAFPVEENTGRVMQAGYEKGGVSDKSFIQQVSVSKDGTPNKGASMSSALPAAGAPQVTVEWVKKSDINVGQECHIELVVKNSSTVPATNVAVDAAFPNSVRLTSVEPKPAQAAEKLSWTFDVLAPGVERRLAIKLIPSRRGDLGTSAEVRFTGQSANVFKVEEPLLKVAIKGPSEVLLGDPASQLITITNPGTGVAHDVKLEAKLSDGLEHPKGERLEIEVGSINPGDSQHVRLGLSAIKGGTHTLTVAATSLSDATATATWKVNVIAPSLKVAADGPALRYKGRNAKYTLTVTNDGSVPNNNVRVTQAVPEGFQFVSADHGGKFDVSQRTVQWFLGRIDAGQVQHMSCELAAVALGDFKHSIIVGSDAGVRAECVAETRVDGTASLATEIVDLADPIEVGSETAWEVRVRNDGSKAATNIAIACELPSGVDLLHAKGATSAIADNRSVTFKLLPQLAPGQQAVYRIHVRGTAEGTHRLRARVTSDSLEESVTIEEATKFYSDEKK